MIRKKKKRCCYCNAVIDTFIIWLICKAVLGLHGKGFFGVGCRSDLCEKKSWAASMTDTVSSKMDLLLHKSELISQAGGASVKTYFKKGKNHSTVQT